MSKKPTLDPSAVQALLVKLTENNTFIANSLAVVVSADHGELPSRIGEGFSNDLAQLALDRADTQYEIIDQLGDLVVSAFEGAL